MISVKNKEYELLNLRTDYILKHDKLHLFVHKEYLSTGITYSDKQQESIT